MKPRSIQMQIFEGMKEEAPRRPLRDVDVVSLPTDANRYTIAVRTAGAASWDCRGNFATRGEAWAAVGRGDHRKNILELIAVGQMDLWETKR